MGVSLRQRTASSRQVKLAATLVRSRGTAHAFVLEVALACAPGTDVAAAQQAERSLAARLADLLPETQLSLIVHAVPMNPRPT